MIRKTVQLILSVAMLLLLAGWNTAPITATGDSAALTPAYKTQLPKDFTMHDYLVYVLEDVQAFWTPLMVDSGYASPAVTYSFPASGEAIETECLLETPDDPLQAFYCSEDDQIVLTQDMAQQLWNGTYKVNVDPPIEYAAGDFSVAFIVAHEYAHNLQNELGWFSVPDETPKATSRSLELNADCLSGVWANSVYARGLLDNADLQEAMRTLADIGEEPSSPNPTHGTPKERTDAFLLGYNSGSAPSCNPYLTTPY